MSLPDLTIGILACKRPWYSVLALNQWKALGYGGTIKFHIADGGSNPEDFAYYKTVAAHHPITFERCGNMSAMVNSCHRHGGEVYIISPDDFVLRYSVDITPEVLMLLANPDIGKVRMSRLSMWGSGSGDPETSGDLIMYGGVHWWKLSKKRSHDGYMSNLGTALYHRRYYEFYGDLKDCASDNPGEAELLNCEQFWTRPDGSRKDEGPTVAVPVRFGQDAPGRGWQEPIWHLGVWRTDEYTRHSNTGRL